MIELPPVVGVAGTNAALKGTFAARRQETHHTLTVELSDILRVEATSRGLTHERENLRAISTEWGRKFGAGALSTMTLDRYEASEDKGTGLSIVSVRRPAEAEVIQAYGGAVVWLDADREVRYERIVNGNRGRVDDLKTFDEFEAEEDAEMYPESDDPFLVNMSAVREIADIQIDNTFVGTEEKTGRVLFEAYLRKHFGM